MTNKKPEREGKKKEIRSFFKSILACIVLANFMITLKIPFNFWLALAIGFGLAVIDDATKS